MEDGCFPLIFGHNDVQENNMMLKLLDNQEVLIIDYEYAGWKPMAMEIAQYVCETMMDNSHPGLNGI